MIGALMASLVEVAGHAPLFPHADETIGEALSRLRPVLVLLDYDDDAAWDDELYDRVRDVGSRVLLFSPSRTQREIDPLSKGRGIPAFSLPIDWTSFRRTIDDVLEQRV
jgi:hypothetical protein